MIFVFLFNLFITLLFCILVVAGMTLASLAMMLIEKKGPYAWAWLKVKLGLAKKVLLQEGLKEVYWRSNHSWVRVSHLSNLKKGDIFTMYNPRTRAFEKNDNHQEQTFILLEAVPKDCEDPAKYVAQCAVWKMEEKESIKDGD